MRKRVILLVMMSTISLIGCGRETSAQEPQNVHMIENIEDINKEESAEAAETKVTYVNYDEVEHKIMFVYQDVNYAEGFYNVGYYIDSKGNRVDFDLSDKGERYGNIEELVDYLEEVDESESKSAFSTEEIQQYYEWLCMIPSFYHLEEKCVMDDAGRQALFGVRYKEGKNIPEIIEIYEEGVWIRRNTNKYARKLSDVEALIEKKMEWENFE